MSIGTLKEMKESQITDLTVNGKCTGCGECCSNLLPISEREYRRIKAYIARHGIKAQEHRINVLVQQPMFDVVCPFCNLDGGNKKCTIYPVRPEICSNFNCHDVANGMTYNGSLDKRLVSMRNLFFGGKKQ